MKNCSLLITMIILFHTLASCTPALTPPATLTATLTPLPTSTPTIIPTITNTPTPTKDPNAPKEFTRYENGVYYLDITDNGTSFTYMYDEEQKLWIRELTPKGGYPLWDSVDYNAIPIRIFISQDVPGGQNIMSITHKDVTDYSDKSPVTGIIIADVGKRFLQKKATHITQPEWSQLVKDLKDGKALIPLITSSGEQVKGTFGPETGFIVTIVSPDLLEPLVGNGVSEAYDQYLVIYSQVQGLDEYGNIICRIASKKPLDQIDDIHLRIIFFFHAANIIGHEDQTRQGYTTHLFLYARASKGGRDDYSKELGIIRNP